jgi:hypothetical protein
VEGEAEGDVDRDAAPHGPRRMDPADPVTWPKRIFPFSFFAN